MMEYNQTGPVYDPHQQSLDAAVSLCTALAVLPILVKLLYELFLPSFLRHIRRNGRDKVAFFDSLGNHAQTHTKSTDTLANSDRSSLSQVSASSGSSFGDDPTTRLSRDAEAIAKRKESVRKYIKVPLISVRGLSYAVRIHSSGNGALRFRCRRSRDASEHHHVPTKNTKTVTILNDINLDFPRGQLHALIGPSGCGKTTLLDVIAANARVGRLEGYATFEGLPYHVGRIAETVRSRSCYLQQRNSPLYMGLNVLETLGFASMLRMPGASKQERLRAISNTIALLDLHDCCLARVEDGASGKGGLSGGQIKRLILGVLLLSSPSVLFLDEVTSGLDATTAGALLVNLRKIADQTGTTIITSIHQPRQEVWKQFHTVTVLLKGRAIFAAGTPTDCLNFFHENGLVKMTSNPADAVMDWIMSAPEASTAAASRHQSTTLAPLAPPTKRLSNRSVLELEVKERAGFITSFCTLLCRTELGLGWRSRLLYPSILIAAGLILVSMFWGRNTTDSHLAFVFMFVGLVNLFGDTLFTPHLLKSLPAISFEVHEGIVSRISLITSALVNVLIDNTVAVTLSLVLSYVALIDAEQLSSSTIWRMAALSATMSTTYICLQTGIIFGASSEGREVRRARLVILAIIAVSMVMGGFFLPYPDAPPFYKYVLMVWNPFFLTFTANAQFLIDSIDYSNSTSCHTNVACDGRLALSLVEPPFEAQVNAWCLAAWAVFAISMAVLSVFMQYRHRVVKFTKASRLKSLEVINAAAASSESLGDVDVFEPAPVSSSSAGHWHVTESIV